MDLAFTAADEQFREEVRTWLEESLKGDFAELRGRGGPGDEEECFDGLLAWEQHRAKSGWLGIAWPKEHGGRGSSLMQQVIFNEEYARARAPGRLSHIGEELTGPTILAFGTEEQKQRYLPGIQSATQMWCQGYSEPGAGSDLANVQTRAIRDGDEWVLEGQKTWTSGAHWSDYAFVLARTQFDVPKHKHTPIEIYGSEGSILVPDPNRFGGEVQVARTGGEWEVQPHSHAHTEGEFRSIGVADMASAILHNRPHRASGALMFLLLPFIIWLFDKSVSSEISFAKFKSAINIGIGFYPGWFIRLTMLALIWAYLHHLIAGVRHLYMDATHSVSREFGRSSAVFTLCASIGLTVLLGAKLFGLY
jgi:succinate dehydrogenase cytochrome b556 subunit